MKLYTQVSNADSPKACLHINNSIRFLHLHKVSDYENVENKLKTFRPPHVKCAEEVMRLGQEPN